MTTNNNLLNNMPTFQTMDTTVKVEPNTIFAQNLPIQVNSNSISDSTAQIPDTKPVIFTNNAHFSNQKLFVLIYLYVDNRKRYSFNGA